MRKRIAFAAAVACGAAAADWHYPQMALEIYRLGVVQETAKKAQMYAAHPGRTATYGDVAEFRRKFAPGEKREYSSARRTKERWSGKEGMLYVTVFGTFRDACAIRSPLGGWEAKTFDGKWRPAARYADSETPPHLQEIPERRDWPQPEPRNGAYDAEMVMLAHIECEAEEEPRLFAGESLSELAFEDRREMEFSPAMARVGERQWRTPVPISLRHFRFANAGAVRNVKLVPVMRDWDAKSNFSAPCKRLEKMREVGAYTLRACSLDFFMDGLKRDRLPWGGDITVSVLADAYVRGDPEISRRSLSVLDAYETDVNGITPYSMWVLIAHDLHQLHFGDREFLEQRWWRLKWRTENLISRCDENGFVAKDLEWTFIDWTKAGAGQARHETAMQTIWYGALEAAAKLADRVRDGEAAERYRAHARKVKESLDRLAWDGRRGLYMAKPGDPSKGFGRHANVFAAVFGMAEGERLESIGAELAAERLPPVTTPYVVGWELCALARTGHVDAFFRRVEKVFGAMLDEGATAFWEGYDAGEKGDEKYAFYGRPWGKSLCHLWSSWPAFIFVSEIMGVKPTSDGWATHEVKPLKGAEGMKAEIPTAGGVVKVEIPAKRQ